MSDPNDTSIPAATVASPADQAEFLASARARSMKPDPGAGPMVRCPRCRTEQRWEEMTKHIVMKEGDSAYRHCANPDCSSISSLEEGQDARRRFNSDEEANSLVLNAEAAGPEPDGPDDGTRPEPGPEPEREPYEPPTLTEINIGAADALIAHHAKELALKLIRVADVVVDEISKANSGGETRGLLDAIKYSLDLAGQADMLGDKAVLRVPTITQVETRPSVVATTPGDIARTAAGECAGCDATPAGDDFKCAVCGRGLSHLPGTAP